MGGRSIRSESQVLMVSDVAREILVRAGWIVYLNCLQQSNETVAIEFLQNLQEHHSMVRGRQIVVTDDIISEVLGLPATRPVWILKKVRLRDAMKIFQDEGQNLTIKGKVVLLTTLGEPWVELVRIIQSYITCDDRKDVVRPRHLKLLTVLKKKCAVNLPVFLNSLFHDVPRSMKKSHHLESVVSHHGLI